MIVALKQREMNPALVGASIALAGIASAIATFMPRLSEAPVFFRLFMAILAGSLAILSAYSSLWMLACYCISEVSALGFKEIRVLFLNPERFGPYWLLGFALLLLLAMSSSIGLFAILR